MAAAQGTCLNPMAAIAAAQMQQMAAFNVSGLVAAPLTPSSGRTLALDILGGRSRGGASPDAVPLQVQAPLRGSARRRCPALPRPLG